MQLGVGGGPYTWPVGKCAFGYWRTAVTRNVASRRPPAGRKSCCPGAAAAAGRRCPARAGVDVPGDDRRADRAGPRAAGVPAATEALAGTCSAPARVMPSRISLVRTPIAGMTSATGSGTWPSPGSGSAAGRPSGTSRIAAADRGGRVAGPAAAPQQPGPGRRGQGQAGQQHGQRERPPVRLPPGRAGRPGPARPAVRLSGRAVPPSGGGAARPPRPRRPAGRRPARRATAAPGRRAAGRSRRGRSARRRIAPLPAASSRLVTRAAGRSPG